MSNVLADYSRFFYCTKNRNPRGNSTARVRCLPWMCRRVIHDYPINVVVEKISHPSYRPPRERTRRCPRLMERTRRAVKKYNNNNNNAWKLRQRAAKRTGRGFKESVKSLGGSLCAPFGSRANKCNSFVFAPAGLFVVDTLAMFQPPPLRTPHRLPRVAFVISSSPRIVELLRNAFRPMPVLP